MTVQSTITCNYAANLAVGATPPDLIVAVTLTSAPGVDLVNTATASGGQPAPCPECTSTDTADASVPNPPAPAATTAATIDTGTDLAFAGVEVGGIGLVGLALIASGLPFIGSMRRRRRQH